MSIRPLDWLIRVSISVRKGFSVTRSANKRHCVASFTRLSSRITASKRPYTSLSMIRATPADFIDVRAVMARAPHLGRRSWNRFTLRSREKISLLFYRYVSTEYFPTHVPRLAQVRSKCVRRFVKIMLSVSSHRPRHSLLNFTRTDRKLPSNDPISRQRLRTRLGVVYKSM